ncbi:MAG: hypothetical protein V4509_01835 [Patescibacteria group bacterium]
MASGQKLADEMLTSHPAYETDDRIGNRWFQGRYRPGIREWGYPVRLPPEQWTPVAKMRGGYDERQNNPFKRTLNNEKIEQRSSRNDRGPQNANDAFQRNGYGSNAS